MTRIIKITAITLMLALMSAGAFAYDFWGVTVGAESYAGSTQLTFDGLAGTDIQYAVGGYKYTRVDSTWYGPFPAASPGSSYSVHRKVDAQGLFFMPDQDGLKFVIITGMPQTGITAPECGYGARAFGPGDLKIDVGGNTYGIGFRLDNLYWAADPNTNNSKFTIHGATGGTESIYARDAGTLGRVELNPRWAHVDHPELLPGVEDGYAFYLKGSGTLAGNATISVANTGLSLSGASVYAYEVSVPWATLGLNQHNFSFRASWRPDCGNDIVAACFRGEYSVPEPGGILAILTGLIGLVGARRRR